jgi:hypothetical protein
MKKVILLAMFLPYLANGQVIENFESAFLANWVQSTEGRWKADTTKSLSGIYSMHHVFDNSASGFDCIGIPVTNLHPDEGPVHWEFLIRHGYDPSASNNWLVFLTSDGDPSSLAAGKASNGYAAGVNLTGYDDTLRIWKIKNGSQIVIATCPINWQNDIGTADYAKIIVERTMSGKWEIAVYDKQDKLKGIASGTDNELFRSSFFILCYRYTSTRDRLLWFDDLIIEGIFREDTQPPVVVSCQISGINSIDLTLDEEPSDDFMLLSNFSLVDDENTPSTIIRECARTFRLTFNSKFSNKDLNRLIINRLCDRSANCKEGISVEFTLIKADPGDVMITEIMADPLPVVSLPGKEYLEIFNRSPFRFNLKKWNLLTESQTTAFPDFGIISGDYIILCSQADTSSFSGYSKVIGLKSFPSLTDDGRMLWISDSLGNLIHGVDYSSSWYGNKLKETGGWSLEMIDTGYPFYADGNWEASSSASGGTPGRYNSSSGNNPDDIFSGIVNVFPDDSVNIRVNFSETVFDPAGVYGKILIEEREAAAVSISDPILRSFIVRSPFSLEKGEVYSMNVSSDLTDFAGNHASRSSFRFGVPEKAGRRDIVFNELLFNPFPDEPDYIELFNCSDRVIDASQLYLASINSDSGDTSKIIPLSDEHRCIIPGVFYTVTTDQAKVIERYSSSDPENIFHISSLPSMPDDRGHLLLLNRNLDLVDEVIYSDKMQYSLLSGREGIALEKIRPEMESNESTNWYSASEASGWGTPGKENSVFSREQENNDRIVFSSAKISPDNDGIEDALIIDADVSGLGNVISVTIFDETGSFVRRLRENLFTQSKTSVVWDGTANDGSLVDTGVYIILIELYNDKGKTKSWKKVCTVIRE